MPEIPFPRDPTCTLFQASRELMGSKSLHLSGFATSHSPTDTGDIKRQAPFQKPGSAGETTLCVYDYNTWGYQCGFLR